MTSLGHNSHTHIPALRPIRGSRSPRNRRRNNQGGSGGGSNSGSGGGQPLQPSPSPLLGRSPQLSPVDPRDQEEGSDNGRQGDGDRDVDGDSGNSPMESPISSSSNENNGSGDGEEVMIRVTGNPLLYGTNQQSSNGDSSELELLLPPTEDEDQTTRSVDLLFFKPPAVEFTQAENTPSLAVQHLAKAELTTKAASPAEKLEPEGVEGFIPLSRTSMLTSDEESTSKLNKRKELGEEDDGLEVVSKESIEERERILKGMAIGAGVLLAVGAGLAVYYLAAKKGGN